MHKLNTTVGVGMWMFHSRLQHGKVFRMRFLRRAGVKPTIMFPVQKSCTSSSAWASDRSPLFNTGV